MRSVAITLRKYLNMGVHFRQVGGARALQIPRRLGRLGFGASTDRAGQGQR